GFLRAHCKVDSSVHLAPEGLQTPGRDWFALLPHAADQAMQCDEWIEEPTVVVTRVEYANFYHTMTDFVGAWSAAVIAGVDPRKMRILFADGHPRSPFDEQAWTDGLSNGHKPLRKGDLKGRHVCFRKLVFALFGYASPITIDWFRANACGYSPWLQSFKSQFLRPFGLEHVPMPAVGADINITLVLREDYVAHPRDGGGGKRHNKISNPDEIMAAMPTEAGVNARRVQMAFLTFQEQIELVRNTNIYIGMHGAALTFLPFLAEDAVIIELVSLRGLNKFHFPNLAAWSGKGFILWRNNIARNEINEYLTKVDPGQFRGLVDKAVGMVRDRRRKGSQR
ncbi:hypothetical protein CYMTET_31592, partial [Cymbomonas tetramitiformis]